MTSNPTERPDLDMKVADILERWPAARALLSERGLDLCCGGVHPLRMAAAAHGQDPEELLGALRRAVEKGGR